MATTVPTQIRIDRETKREANELFRDLGTDMSTAVNMFLKQCVMTESIPLKIQRPRFSEELIEAIEEAEHMADNPDTPRYETFEEYQAAMQEQLEDE